MTGAADEGNAAFEGLLREAGFSRDGLARRLNALGRSRGLAFRYSKSSVAGWVNKGQRPRAAAASLILVILSERLRRPVSAADVGWPAPDGDGLAARVLTYLGVSQVRSVLPELWGADLVDRRGFMAGAVVVPSFAPALNDYLVRGPDRDLAHDGAGLRVGETDVRMIEQLTAHFRAMDHQYGGGQFRADAVAALHRHVAPRLRGTYTDAVGRALWGAISELSTLVGWLSFDAGRKALAARYYSTALRLAQGAGDVSRAGYALTRIAHLMLSQNRATDVVTVALTARTDGERSGRATPRMQAEYGLNQAIGWGALGDKEAVRRAVSDATHAWEAGPHDDDPAWQALDRAELRSAAAMAYRRAGLVREGLAAIEDANSERDATFFTRRHAFSCVSKAHLLLSAGDAEQAADAATQAVELAPSLTSARLPGFLREFGKRLTDEVGGPLATDFTDRLRALPQPT